MKNYYKILGVPTDSPQAEIKKAYRMLAVKHHPDKNDGDSSSEERFKEISEAYIILGDVAKRNAYDFAKGYQKNFRDRSPASGTQTPATFLMLFKKIKNRVYHAGGYINQDALFKVIDDLLSDENIEFLVGYADTGTNSLIIDDILVSSIFLDNFKRAILHKKLLKLANGNTWLISKVNRLQEIYPLRNNEREKGTVEKPAIVSIIFFVAIVLFIIVLILT